MSLAADIRHEVARTKDQLRWLDARATDPHISDFVIPLVRNRLAKLIADHAVVARGMR